MEANRNSNFAQAPLGVLMLDTAFARPMGDAGNPASWPFAVAIERVNGAHARPIVDGSHCDLSAFIAAGQRLIARGAYAIITTCGFLVRQQHALSAALAVPVVTSTLTQYARLSRALPHPQRLAILTISANALDRATGQCAGVDGDALVFSLPSDSHFVGAILDGHPALNVDLARNEWVALACACKRAHPEIGGWLFECANMPPYASAVAAATGLSVYHTLTLGAELHARHAPSAPPATGGVKP